MVLPLLNNISDIQEPVEKEKKKTDRQTKIAHNRKLKNTLSFGTGILSLSIVLALLKQMDDPQHVTQEKRTSSFNDLKLYNYTVAHEDVPDGLKILQISDLHLDKDRPEQLEKLRSIANEMEDIDFVLMTGDLSEPGNKSYVDLAALPLFKEILQKANHGFYVMGNHEYQGEGNYQLQMDSLLSSIGYKNTADTLYEIEIDGKVVGVTGIDLYQEGSPKEIKYTLSEDGFNILLVHEVD